MGGILFACLHRSPEGGSTLITSAPKSERITAAPGAATKVAKSTTLSPEKMLSVAIGVLLNASGAYSPSVEPGCAPFEEGRRALLLVLGRGAQPEIGGFQREALALARINSLVDRVERISDGHRRIGGDLLEDRFRTRDEVRSGNDLVDEPDAEGLLRADHPAGQNELKRAALSNEPRQPLRAAAAGKQSQLDLRLTELRMLDRDADGAGHCRLAAAAQCKAVDCRDHRLSEILDEIEHLLPVAAGPLGVDRTRMRELADVGAGNECLVARAGENDAAHGSVIPCILERSSQILPRRRVQGVEHLGPVNGHIGDRVALLVLDVCECQCCR